MQARIAKLEEFALDAKERLVKIEMRLEQTATKGDIHEAANTQIKWLVGALLVIASLAITIMTFVQNNATPKAPAAAAQPPQPINIYTQPVQAAAAGAATVPQPAPAEKP